MAFTVLSLWSTAVFAQSWSSDVLIAKKGVKQSTMPDSTAQLRNEKVSVFMKTLNEKYGAQTSVFLRKAGASSYNWLSSCDSKIEKLALENVVKDFKNPTYFQKLINDVKGTEQEKVAAYLNLFSRALIIVNLEEKLIWIDPSNVRKSFDNFKNTKGYDATTYGAKLAELESACKIGYDGIYTENVAAIDNAKKILALSSEVLMSNPALDFDKIIVGKYKLGSARARMVMSPSLGTQNNNWSNQMTAARRGFDAEIAEMSNLRGDKTFRTIYKPRDKVALTDFQLHWYSDKMIFTSINEMGLWSVFEVKTDGSGLREVIKVDDPDLEFIDGAYLPDGRFIAISNIGYQGVPCVNGSDPVGNLTIYDPKTHKLRRTTFDQDANWHPVVMNNGRLMYVRWEYTDLTHYFSRIVMHANPDGTEVKALYGSGCFFPNSTFDVKPIPGNDSKFVAVISGHHGVARSGRMMLFDPAKGRTSIDGMVQEFPFSKRPIIPIIKDELVNDVWPQFIKPYPINEKYYLVSAKLSPTSLWGIYLVDIYDNMTLVAEQEEYGFISPTVVEKRPTPPIIPDKVDLTKKDGTVFIQDIYQGEGLPDVPRGTVKKLRIFAYEYAYIRSPSDHVAQGIQSGWDIKRLIGEVDVEPDGSAMFKVPANTPISLQPLDSEGRAIQWMRSWITAMPGETVSCVGCHENQNSIVPPKRVAASMKAPSKVITPEGGVRPFVFALEIQPILNRACIACHNKGSMDMRGEMKATNDSEIKKVGSWTINPEEMDAYYGFSKSYLAIHPFVSRQGPEADALVMKPYEYHASTSELVKILKNNHHGVKLTDAEWRTLYAWIDMNAPFHSSFRQYDLNGFNQIERRKELSRKYNDFEVDWVKEIEDYTTLLNSKPKVEPVKPPKEEITYKAVKAKHWPIAAADAVEMQTSLGENSMELKISDNVTIKLRKVPSGEFVMGSNVFGHQCAPETRVKIDKPYWIGEIEITNQQFNVVFPKHDNRYIAQMWKDHTGPGYEANRPLQPVIRVSQREAVEFCRKISEKTGMKVSLPTEAQWEWACRAGSNGDFWYGNSNTDFAPYENLADVQLEKMAVSGVNPQPMSKDNPWFRYLNFIPKVATVDDGSMLLVEG
ncbi:MAG: SUMF1/EgtB/PvdO family nonheme iron enzyme, partial [Rikenellaceae bacterium]